jgi:hypothetical protein
VSVKQITSHKQTNQEAVVNKAFNIFLCLYFLWVVLHIKKAHAAKADIVDGHYEQHDTLKSQGLVPKAVVCNFIIEPVPIDIGKYSRNDSPEDAARDKEKPSDDFRFDLLLFHSLYRIDPHPLRRGLRGIN